MLNQLPGIPESCFAEHVATVRLDCELTNGKL
ncbi:protein of unknown function [Pararobbsia alpina]